MPLSCYYSFVFESMTSSSSAQTKPGPRGRGATSPIEIPGKGWKDILLRVYAEFGDDRVMLVAAGVTYYLLLAFVPALTAIVSIYSVFSDPATIQDQVTVLSSFLPGGAMQLIEEQLKRLVGQDDAALGLAFVISVGLALWSTNAGMKAIFDAMNVAYDEQETRSFIVLTLKSMLFTLAFVIGSIAIVGVVLILPVVLNFLFLGQSTEMLIRVASYAIMFVLFAFAIAAVYRWGPDRDRAKWRWITPGAIFATVVIAAASFGFSWYVANFGSYNATYGSLGAIIGFITWIWISMIILIMGAELNAESERQTKRDSTTGAREPMGARGAYAADNLGAKTGNILDDESRSPDVAAAEGQTAAAARQKAKLPGSALLVMVPIAILAGILSRR